MLRACLAHGKQPIHAKLGRCRIKMISYTPIEHKLKV